MSLYKPPANLRQRATQRARELRRGQTKAERILWTSVRNRGLSGLKFYRQYPLFSELDERPSFFIADFFCAEKKLVVEIDGKIHDDQKDRDRLRTQIIEAHGLRVIRFRNEEIDTNLAGVLKAIASHALT